MKPPFTYVGNKQRFLKYIIPRIPPHKYYGEVFGGSGSVLLSKPISEMEVYNDLDSEVVNFYKVLRENPDELRRLICLTPYSREEYLNSHYNVENDLERARRFFIRARMGMSGFQNAKTSFSMSVTLLNRNMPATCSRYLSSIEGLEEVAVRLSKVQFENIDFRRFFKIYISKWNSQFPEETFIYLDPPYLQKIENTKTLYKGNFTEEDEDELLDLITNRYKSVRYMVSNYDNEKFNEILGGWEKFCFKIKTTSNSKSNNKERTECLWMNYHY